jgi:adenine-specific DNA-methyltransferase
MDLQDHNVSIQVDQGSALLASHLKGMHQKTQKKLVINKEAFPSTRYYGSKLRLIEWIATVLNEQHFNKVLDAFGGTATVSLLLKALGKDVTYNDALMCNTHIARAVLAPEEEELNYKLITEFPDRVIESSGFITDTFKGIYFLDSENQWLDGAIEEIKKESSCQHQSDILYCLFQACLQKRPFNIFHRKNLDIRTNNKKDTKFGNWRTWERSFAELMTRAAKELLRARQIKEGRAKILPPTDASEILPGYDLVYLDPPYITARKNDTTYLDRYHFLEGLSRYEEWPSLIDYRKKNLPFMGSGAFQEWNHKSTFKDRLFGMIEAHNKSIVVMSYATGGHPDIKEIVESFKVNFSEVVTLRQNMSHALRKTRVEEILIIGKP